MGLKPRTGPTPARAARARATVLEAEVARLTAELESEGQRARYLEVELQETTDKYQELTRKSVDFEEDKADVEQERDRAARERDQAARERDQAVRERDEAARERDEAARERDEAARERDEAAGRAKALQRRVDALEKEASWGMEGKRKLAAAQKRLVEMKAEIDILRERAAATPAAAPPRARTEPGPPRPAAPHTAAVAPAGPGAPPPPRSAASSRLPLRAPAFDEEEEDTTVDSGPLMDRFDVGRDRDD